MRAHVLQHAPFEGPGSIGDWLEARRAVVRVSRLFAGDPLPTTEAFDFLIALGGPMSVNDEADLAWLAPEKALVREAIAREIPIVGVCLGAQLIASALGACVYRSQTSGLEVVAHVLTAVVVAEREADRQGIGRGERARPRPGADGVDAAHDEHGAEQAVKHRAARRVGRARSLPAGIL